MQQLPENILNVNQKSLKIVLHINRDFINLLSNSWFKFELRDK